MRGTAHGSDHNEALNARLILHARADVVTVSRFEMNLNIVLKAQDDMCVLPSIHASQ